MSKLRLKILEEIPIFGGIRPDILTFILARSVSVSISKGDHFFREGDQGSSLYVIEQGSVCVYRQRQNKNIILLVLKMGDCFGEMALTDLFPRSADVKALEDTTTFEISNRLLFDVYKEDLEQFTMIQMNIARELSRRLRKSDELLMEQWRG